MPEPLLEDLFTRYPALAPGREDLLAAVDLLAAAFARGNKLLLCGNGGSAADCEHIAGELLKSFMRPRPLPAEQQAALCALGTEGERLAGALQQGLPALPLTGFPSFTTAFGNDVDPQLAFAQLTLALGRPGDVLLAISTSGQARNVCAAARAARAAGMTVLGLSRGEGGALASLCDLCLLVPGSLTPDVQEYHLPVYHFLCRAVEARLFSS